LRQAGPARSEFPAIESDLEIIAGELAGLPRDRELRISS
jgi:hypothetical protein